jgi:hypothetical protein
MNWTTEQWQSSLRSVDPIERDNATLQLQSRVRKAIFAQFLEKGLTGHCVEDVVQETTLRIFRQLDTFRGESNVRGEDLVRHHLAICLECQEEFEMIKAIAKSGLLGDDV